TDSEYPALHMYSGKALSALGRLDAAARSFQRAIDLEPENFAFALEYGIALLDAEARSEAIRLFERAIALAPRNPVPRGYRRLAWVDDPAGRESILADARDLPEHFKARLLARVLGRAIASRGPDEALNRDPFDDEPAPRTFGWLPRLGAWRRRRILTKAQ